MKFTVGIPAFKSTYLKECIDSILSQSFRDFELIVINDASPMDIDSIISSYDNKLLRYYKNEINYGGPNVVNNWNKCLSFANGEFFVLMGDDDKMEPNYLEEFNSLISQYSNLDVYHCRSTIIDENAQALTLTPSWPEYESVYENIWHRRSGKRRQFISDFVYRTAPLRRRGGFHFVPLGWATDDITAYIAIGNKGIAHTNKPIFNYRQHATSISMNGNWYLKMKAVMEYEKWLRNFLEEKPTSKVDILVHENIKLNFKKSFQKQKTQIIKESLNGNSLLTLTKWIKLRNNYQISVFEVIYSYITFLKTKIVKRKLKNM